MLEYVWHFHRCKKRRRDATLFCPLDSEYLDLHDIEGEDRRSDISDDEQQNSKLYL